MSNNADERDFSEYDFDPEITEQNGFAIGDEIVITEDDEAQAIFEGEEGQVVGFTNIPPATDPDIARAFGNDPKGRIAMYVLFDGTSEPIEVKYDQAEVQ